MTWCLRADVDISIDDLQIAPGTGLGLSRQAAKIIELSRLVYLDKCCAIGLANGAKFSSS